MGIEDYKVTIDKANLPAGVEIKLVSPNARRSTVKTVAAHWPTPIVCAR